MGTPSSHRFSNILQDLWSHIVERDIDLAADLALYVVGNTDASCLGDPFKASGDIYPVPEDIVVVDDDVAEVNADAEFDSDLLRHIAVLHGHTTLAFTRPELC